jgi:hypothetical protein
MTLHSKVRLRSDLSSHDIDAMYGLMTRHYDNTSFPIFLDDLNEKQWIIELRDDATGALKGFSTQRLIEAVVDGEMVTALFSGDTIVDRDCWGSPLLAVAWGQLAVRIMEQKQDRNLYWFLICKGFRTYRFLSVFFEEFSPCWNRETSPYHQRILETFAIQKFGSQYDAARGILKANQEAYRIKSEIDQLSDHRRDDPHIAFFFERNPGFQQGDELCCLARLSVSNFSRAAKRLMATPAFARTEP